MNWVLPNHDAFTVHPNDASEVRRLYTKMLTAIYKDRKTILRNYLDSIGIDKTYEDKDTEEVEEFSGYCLKQLIELNGESVMDSPKRQGQVLRKGYLALIFC